MSTFICVVCGGVFEQVRGKGRKRKYCGSMRIRNGCAFEVYKRRVHINHRRRAKIPNTRAWFYKRYRNKKEQAIKRGIEFLLTFKEYEFYRKQNKCGYCCLELGEWTLDRKENTIGYEFDNCMVACMRCNRIKGNSFTYEEMKLLGNTISKIEFSRRIKPVVLNRTPQHSSPFYFGRDRKSSHHTWSNPKWG